MRHADVFVQGFTGGLAGAAITFLLWQGKIMQAGIAIGVGLAIGGLHAGLHAWLWRRPS